MAEITIKLSYSLPPCSPLTDADAARLAHDDLATMQRDDLALELSRVKLTLAFGDFRQSPVWARDWLRERVRRCERALKGGAR